MASVRFKDVEQGRWYRISLFSDHCKAYNRTIEYFEARLDGQSWKDIKEVQYSVYSVFDIDDELAY
jgi:hypothetical protein